MKAPCWLELDRSADGGLVVRVRIDGVRRLLSFAWSAAAGFSGWRRPAAFWLVLWWRLTGRTHKLVVAP